MGTGFSEPSALEIECSFQQTMENIGGFESAPALAVAVSGGSDSMALLHLSNRWARARGGRVVALTVDHGLRADSAKEAAQVEVWCSALGIPHHILYWSAPALRTGIQEKAREARYALLTAWCREHHVLHLLTGHQQDDQSETLLFRLARGSELKGLAAIALCSQRQDVRLLRPLLPYPNQLLKNYLRATGQPWLEDPTNLSMAYTRNQLRRALIPAASTSASALAARLAAIRSALDALEATALASLITIMPEGYASLKLDRLSTTPPVLLQSALQAALLTIGGSEHPLRSDAMKRLMTRISSASSLQHFPIAGAMLHRQPQQGRLLLFRDPSALAPLLPACRGEWQHWDKRFWLRYEAPDANVSFHWGALGAQGLSILRQRHVKTPSLPARLLHTFPALWSLEQLVALPHIGYIHPDYRDVEYFVRFLPAKPLAAMAFFGLNRT